MIFCEKKIGYASFIAIEDCDCYLFTEEMVYDGVLLKDEAVIRDLIHWFCHRMASLNHQVTDGLVKDPRYRVCKFLADYVQQFGKRDGEGRYVYQGKLSHYDIAKYLGMNWVSVTNVMKQL